MVSVFGQVERKLYDALLIPDTSERQKALERWIHIATPVIQATITQELENFINSLVKDRWTDDGWQQFKKKIYEIENQYHMVLEIKLRRIDKNEKYQGSLPEPIYRFEIGSNVNREPPKFNSIMKKNEIDLHGMTANEAKLHVEDFLKDCYKTKERTVWIIHGKGTGALKEMVQTLLRSHPFVKSFITADKSHGGEGAIQVELKES